MVMSLPREAYVSFNLMRLSDHNRGEVEQSFERIENRVRTARGRMRKSYVADKRSFSISWSTLPESDEETVDGFAGARTIINFYESTPGEFILSLAQEDDTSETFNVVFNSFTYSIVHRFDSYYYDITLSLEEV